MIEVQSGSHLWVKTTSCGWKTHMGAVTQQEIIKSFRGIHK